VQGCIEREREEGERREVEEAGGLVVMRMKRKMEGRGPQRSDD